MYTDKTLTCQDCSAEFTFNAEEQEFHAQKGFNNDPKRCPTCRAARKNQGGGSGRQQRQLYEVVCAACGTNTTVPFRPSGDRPVYCRDCFQSAAR